MVKNITGIVNVLIIIFLLYRTAVCATRKEFKVSDIILLAVMVVILIVSFIIRIKFTDR